MKTIKRMSMVFALMIIYATTSFGYNDYSKKNNRRRQGPPPEAYTACEGKNSGDEASFESRRGDTVSGTCALEGDRLVLRPDRSQMRSGRKHHNPPQEAYTACEGKNSGDEAEFSSPHGDVIKGTCEKEGDRLVLRPEHGKMGSGKMGQDHPGR